MIFAFLICDVLQVPLIDGANMRSGFLPKMQLSVTTFNFKCTDDILALLILLPVMFFIFYIYMYIRLKNYKRLEILVSDRMFTLTKSFPTHH